MTTTAQFPDEQVDGAFARQDDAFTNWVRADGSSGYPAAAGRYHLYVSLACPWAHRTIIIRTLKKLETAIGMSIVDPIRDERGWKFTVDAGPDPINNFEYLSQAYSETDPMYHGRVTVPVLWDKESKRIVSNNDESHHAHARDRVRRVRRQQRHRFLSRAPCRRNRRAQRRNL